MKYLSRKIRKKLWSFWKKPFIDFWMTTKLGDK